MARDDDDDRIFIIGATYSSDSFRASCEESLFFIAASFSIGDIFQCFPGFSLEVCPIRCKWYGKMFPLSGEIFIELEFCFCEQRMLRTSQRSVLFHFFLKLFCVCKLEHHEMSIVSNRDKIAERRVDDRSIHRANYRDFAIFFEGKIY
jgi:hypothetical protein